MPDGPTSPEEATKEPSMKDAPEKRGPLLDRLTGARKGRSPEASPKPKEKPETKTTREKVERETDTREEVEEALYTSFGLLEATDDSKLSPELQWAKKAVRETIHKTLDHDRDTARVDFDSEYTHFSIEEGIPVDHIIEFLNKKINATKDSAEREIWRDRRDILFRNSVAFYDVDSSRSNPEQMVARTKYEAYLVGQDSRNKGNDAENWETAEQQLSKRRELFLTPTVIEAPSEAAEPEEKPGDEKPIDEKPIDEKPPVEEFGEEATVKGPPPPPELREKIAILGNMAEAPRKRSDIEADQQHREEMRRFGFWDPRRWGLRLGAEWFKAQQAQRKVEAAIEEANSFATVEFKKGGKIDADKGKEAEEREKKAGIERAKLGEAFEGEKIKEVSGELKKKLVADILQPIINGEIKDEKELQKKLRAFIEANQSDDDVKEIFGPDATKYKVWADYFASDLLEMGQWVKDSMATHSKTLEQMDEYIKIKFANLSWAHETDTDTSVNKFIRMTQGGKNRGWLLNPATVGFGASVLTGVGIRTTGIAASAAASVVPGVGAVAGGLFAGARRYGEYKVDRATAAVERTYNQKSDGKAPRREAFNELDYDRTTIAELRNGGGRDILTGEERQSFETLAGADLGEGQQSNREAFLRRVAEAKARLELSRKAGIDLITYDSYESVAQNRLQLAQDAVLARQKLEEAGMSKDEISTLETKLIGEYKERLLRNKSEQDRAFQIKRLQNAAGSALFGGLAGLAGGAVGQQAIALAGRGLGINVGETGLEWAAKNLGGVGKGAKAAASEIRANAAASVVNEVQTGPKPSAAAIKEVVETTIVNQDRPVLGPNGEWTKNAINVDERIWEKGNSQLLHTVKDGNKLGLDITRMTENVQKLVQNGQIGFAFTTNDGQTVFIPENSDMVKDGVLWLDPNAEGQRGVISKMVLNQEALGKLTNGDVATELYNRKDVFNVKYIEAGQMVQDGNKNVLHAYATIQGTGNMPSTVEVPTETPKPITETPKPIQTPPPTETPRPITTPTPTPTPGGGFDFGIPRNGPEIQMPPVIPVPFSPRHPLEPISSEKPGETKKEESKSPTDARLEAIGVAPTSPKAPETEKSVSPEASKEPKIEVGTKVIRRDGGDEFTIVREDDKRVTLERKREDGSLESRVTLDRKDLEEKLKTPGSAWKASDVTPEPKKTPEPEGPRPEPEITEDDQAVRQELTKLLHGQMDPNMRIEMARARLAELKGETTGAPKEAETTAETRNVKSFKTELGSIYTYDTEGKSTRLTPDGETHSRKDVTVFVKLNDIETDTYMNALQNPETFGHVYVFEKQGEELKPVRDIKDITNPNEVYVGIFKEGKIGKLNKASTKPVRDHNVFEMGKSNDGFTTRHLGHKVTDIEFEETAPAPSIPTPSSTTTSTTVTPPTGEEEKPVVETVTTPESNLVPPAEPVIAETTVAEEAPSESLSTTPEINVGTKLVSTNTGQEYEVKSVDSGGKEGQQDIVLEDSKGEAISMTKAALEHELALPDSRFKVVSPEEAPIEHPAEEPVLPPQKDEIPAGTFMNSAPEPVVPAPEVTPITTEAPSETSVVEPSEPVEEEIEVPPGTPKFDSGGRVVGFEKEEAPKEPMEEKTIELGDIASYPEYIVPTDNPVEALRRIVDMKPEQIREIYKKEFGKEWEGTTTDLKFELGQEAVRQAYVREGRGPKIESTLPKPTAPEEPVGESLEDLEARKDLTKLLHGQVDPNMPIETVWARLEQLRKEPEEKVEAAVEEKPKEEKTESRKKIFKGVKFPSFKRKKGEKKPETEAVKNETPAETAEERARKYHLAIEERKQQLAEEDKKKKGRNGKDGRPEILDNSRMRGKRFSELTTRIKKNIGKRKK